VAFDARYVNDRYHGIGRHAYNLIRALSQLDPDRLYIAYYHPGYSNSRFDMHALQEESNIELRPVSLSLHRPREQLVWPALLARARADLFHSPYVTCPVASHTRCVITIHDLTLEQYPEYRPREYLHWLYRTAARLSVKRASLVLTVSAFTGREVRAYYGADAARVRVTGNAVDPSFHREQDMDRLAAVRERYGLPPRFVLAVGVGRPHKNLEVLVAAFARLDPALAPALVLAGEVDRRFPDGVAACIDAAGLGDRVLRPGIIREADLRALYSLADVFAFPSLAEGFGLPPLEAMACGTPVVAANSPAVSETVGDAALLFDPRDPSGLTEQLSRALRDSQLRVSLIRRGVERAGGFTWERVAKQTLQAYASLESR
jgi:glycosyltransferase involved in cell wall biosynthesis